MINSFKKIFAIAALILELAVIAQLSSALPSGLLTEGMEIIHEQSE